MAEIGTAYRPAKATRMHLEQLEKHPPIAFPEFKLVTIRLDGPIETNEQLEAIVREMDADGAL
jgi:hypothetical protein